MRVNELLFILRLFECYLIVSGSLLFLDKTFREGVERKVQGYRRDNDALYQATGKGKEGSPLPVRTTC